MGLAISCKLKQKGMDVIVFDIQPPSEEAGYISGSAFPVDDGVPSSCLYSK